MSFSEVMCEPACTVSQAARQGNLELLKSLIAEGHPVDVCDNRGWRALHEASFGNFAECLQELLKSCSGEGDINWPSHEGQTPLFIACQQRSVECFRLLLDAGANPNICDFVETYPLLEATRGRSIELVEMLIAHGANVNCQLYCGTSPLHHAASMNNLTMTECLLKHGAKLDVVEENGLTPIFTAAQYGQEDCLRAMLEHAKRKGDKRVVNKTADDGASPLYIAAQEGHVDCVRTLLEHGADAGIMTTCEPRAVPLIAAIEFTRIECIEVLMPVTKQQSLQECDVSPWYMIFHCGDYKIRGQLTKILLDHGADPNYQHGKDTEDVYTRFPKILRFLPTDSMLFYKCIRPLTKASYFESAQHPSPLIKHLIDAGAYINAQSFFEMAPILPALENSKICVINTLVQNGATLDIYHPKIQGNLTLLLSLHRWKSFQFLLQNGAEIHSVLDYVSYLHCFDNYSRKMKQFHHSSKDAGKCGYCRSDAGISLQGSNAESNAYSKKHMSDNTSNHTKASQHTYYEQNCDACKQLREKRDRLLQHAQNAAFASPSRNRSSTRKKARRSDRLSSGDSIPSQAGDQNSDSNSYDENDDFFSGPDERSFKDTEHICGGAPVQQKIIEDMDFIQDKAFFIGARHVMSGNPYHVSIGQVLLCLLRYAGTVNPSHTILAYIDSDDERRKVAEITESPRPMAHLCRVTIRRCLGSQRIFHQERTRRQLDLPRHIMDFIFMKDLQGD